MDEDYIKTSINEYLNMELGSTIDLKYLKKISEGLHDLLKDKILEFHRFQNRELTKELLNKEIRLRKLESRTLHKD